MLSSVEREQLRRWTNDPEPRYPIVFNTDVSKYGWSFGSYSTNPIFDTREDAESAFVRYIGGLRRYGAQNSGLVGVISALYPHRRAEADKARSA